MEHLKQAIGENLEYIRIIVDNKLELAKLEGSEKTAKVISFVMLSFIMASVIALVLLFLGIGLALYLQQFTGSYFVSFAIVGGILLLMGFILIMMRNRWIISPVFNYILDEIVDQE